MNEEIDPITEKTLNDVDRAFAIGGIAVSSLAFLFYPADEIENVSETDLGFVGTISNIISVLSLIGTLWTIGLLYERNAPLPKLVRRWLVPLVVLDVALFALIIAIRVIGTEGIKKVGTFALKKMKPVICSFGAFGLLFAMAVVPKQLLTVTNVGMFIHFSPAVISASPLNKNPYYIIVVLIRAGGLATSLAGDIIDVVTDENYQGEQPLLES